MENIIHINEDELKRLLKECVEIDHREATIPIVNNLNAQDEMMHGNSSESKTPSFLKQRTNTGSEIYNQITQGVKDNIGGSLRLTFGRRELDRSTSTVEFFFEEVLLLTPKRAVIQGRVNDSRSSIFIGKSKPKRIQIDYHFEDQCFYEAVYCANGTVRDLKRLTLDYAEDETNRNVNTAINLIQFLSMCLYSIDDGETTINQKEISKGKGKKRIDDITMNALSLAITDDFQNLKLEFVEHNDKTNQSYPVDFEFNEVKYIDTERMVLYGQLTVSLRPFGAGSIEYNFKSQNFYRVSYSDKTTRSRKLHALIPHNQDEINKLLAFIANYLYAGEDDEADASTNGATLSKRV